MNSYRKILIVLLGSAVAALPASAGRASDGAEAELPPVSEADVESVVQANNAFALDLYATLKNEEGNLFFSPYSISTALGMTYAGARGQTASQMAEVLHFAIGQDQLHPAMGALIRRSKADEDAGYVLRVANRLWGQKGHGFLKGFLDLTKLHYGAGLAEVDFKTAHEAARTEINHWVELQTEEKIKGLIQEGLLNEATRLVLTNAIYFKGDWARQFPERRTADAPFRLNERETVDVPLMNQKGEFGYMQGDGLQVLELPYVGNELSMVVFLPEEVNGLAALEQTLTLEKVKEWLAKLRSRKVVVFLPRFEMTRRFELSSKLQGMGMRDAFRPGLADLSGIDGKRYLFLSFVVHQAFVRVDEEGTEAAAATAVGAKGTSLSPPDPVFRADHPFVFVIRDRRTDSILFLGRVVDPTVPS